MYESIHFFRSLILVENIERENLEEEIRASCVERYRLIATLRRLSLWKSSDKAKMNFSRRLGKGWRNRVA